MLSIRKNSANDFTLLIASASKTAPELVPDTSDLGICLNGMPLILTVQYGDFSEPLLKVVNALAEAAKYASNDKQMAYLDNCIKS